MVLPSSWTAKSDAGSPIIYHLVFKILTGIGDSSSLQSDHDNPLEKVCSYMFDSVKQWSGRCLRS